VLWNKTSVIAKYLVQTLAVAEQVDEDNDEECPSNQRGQITYNDTSIDIIVNSNGQVVYKVPNIVDFKQAASHECENVDVKKFHCC
jgi:hypothetical protein